MKRYVKRLTLSLSLVVLAATVSACGGTNTNKGASETGSANPQKVDKKTYKWFVARGVDSPPAVTVKEIAEEFSRTHPEFELVLEGTGIVRPTCRSCGP